MKMKTNNLPAVLLAVIMAALMILTSGLFDQAHADTDYWVEITPEAETWVALPGDTIPVSAKVYYDFDWLDKDSDKFTLVFDSARILHMN